MEILLTHAGGIWLVSLENLQFFVLHILYILHIDYWHCCILHINYWYHSRASVLMVVRLLEILFFAKNVKNLYQKHY